MKNLSAFSFLSPSCHSKPIWLFVKHKRCLVRERRCRLNPVDFFIIWKKTAGTVYKISCFVPQSYRFGKRQNEMRVSKWRLILLDCGQIKQNMTWFLAVTMVVFLSGIILGQWYHSKVAFYMDIWDVHRLEFSINGDLSSVTLHISTA